MKEKFPSSCLLSTGGDSCYLMNANYIGKPAVLHYLKHYTLHFHKGDSYLLEQGGHRC